MQKSQFTDNIHSRLNSRIHSSFPRVTKIFFSEGEDPINSGKMAKRVKLELQNEQLYLNAATADVHFKCDSEDGRVEYIPAHRLIMIIASEAFRDIFYGSTQDPLQLSYHIEDVSAEAFKEFLQLIYLEKAKLTKKNAMQVIGLVKKYNIKGSLDSFKALLETEIGRENICWCYKLANFSGFDSLKKLCEAEIMWNTEKVLKSNDFLSCTRSNLINLLQMDRFSCNESLVFSACIKWAMMACERECLDIHRNSQTLRQMLGNVLHHIRFRSMSFEEFATQIASVPGLFLAEEYEDIFGMIRIKHLKSEIFNYKLRLMPTYEQDSGLKCTLNRKEHTSKASSRSYRNVEMTTFSVNKPILLGEFDCLPIKCHNSLYSIPLSLLTITKKPMENIENHLRSASDGNVVIHDELITFNECDQRIHLSKSLRIDPGFKYEIRFEQPFNGVFLKDIIFEQITPKQFEEITIQFHDDDGLVSAMYFNRI